MIGEASVQNQNLHRIGKSDEAMFSDPVDVLNEDAAFWSAWK
jgi:hypothetical protein